MGTSFPFLSRGNCPAPVDETTQSSADALSWSRAVDALQELGSESRRAGLPPALLPRN